jgi:mannose-1-phosphate guanylyltransferase
MCSRCIVPVILAGGSGTRLWPLSTPEHPKQFLSLFDQYSFLQSTINRVKHVSHVTEPLIICGQEHLWLVEKHLKAISVNSSSIIIEPIGRNTAPAIALAALQQVETLEDPILLILPSDHMISNELQFQQAIVQGAVYAEEGNLVTFGIVPNRPDINYGYIKAGQRFDSSSSTCRVDRFVEKPVLQVAQQYLVSQNYYWNSGMFMFRASTFLKELSVFEPEILACCQAIKPYLCSSTTEKTHSIPLSLFEVCPKKSIDYAVMERTNHAVVMPLDIGWSDIGSWYALWDYHSKDKDGNAVWGKVNLDKVKNSLVYVKDKKLDLNAIENRVIVHANNEVFESYLEHPVYV